MTPDWTEKPMKALTNNHVIAALMRSLKLFNPGIDYLSSNLTVRADIEFTSDCNLRCAYCASLKPGYQRQNLDLGYLDRILETLKRRRAVAVGVSGHGETTIVPGWDLHCRKMLDQGLELYISSNFAREFSQEEVQTLSRFMIIQVSCDTDDSRLFRQLRRGGDFKTLAYNMTKIRAQALQDGRRAPEYWWHCVVSDRTVWKLEETVSHGLSLGVKLFNFINLVKHTDVEAMTSIKHINEMSWDELYEIASLFSKTLHTITKNRATYICDSLFEGLRDRLVSETAHRCSSVDCPPHSTAQGGGMTRDCMDPWLYTKVGADAGVVPCCRSLAALDYLGPNRFLDDILNGERMRKLRESLLTANLEEVCKTCNIRKWTSVEILKLKVALFLTFGGVVPTLHKLGVLLPIIYRLRRLKPRITV